MANNQLQDIKNHVDMLISKEPERIQRLFNNTKFVLMRLKSVDLTSYEHLKDPRKVLEFLIVSRYTKNLETRTIRNGLLWFLHKYHYNRNRRGVYDLTNAILRMANEDNMYNY